MAAATTPSRSPRPARARARRPGIRADTSCVTRSVSSEAGVVPPGRGARRRTCEGPPTDGRPLAVVGAGGPSVERHELPGARCVDTGDRVAASLDDGVVGGVDRQVRILGLLDLIGERGRWAVDVADVVAQQRTDRRIAVFTARDHEIVDDRIAAVCVTVPRPIVDQLFPLSAPWRWSRMVAPAFPGVTAPEKVPRHPGVSFAW